MESKSTKNPLESRGKRHLPQKSIRKRSLEHPWSQKVDFWLIFWLLGVQMCAQVDNFLYFMRRELSAREARARF